ncbi:MAG TPA: cupin domain-containing protein [Rhizomicrobium sp.]|nr:cupin domain-containing protein [Rhizomicrobium sp.]
MHKTRGKLALGFVVGAAMILPALAQPKEEAWFAWSPKPDKLVPYGQNKPVTRLPVVLAKHKGQARWSEQVILTPRYDVKWIQAAPGDKTPVQYFGDDRVFWVAWGGQIRFTIEGQKPFVASKGFLVQVPQRVRYSMETIGTEPSLRFEVAHTGIKPNYPADGAKPSQAGDGYIKISTPTQPDKYDSLNRPYRDFFKEVVAADPVANPKDHLVMADEANMANIIRGKGVPTPPPTNKGHFHIIHDEFWFILEGKCDYLIEDAGLFTADTGDVVFVPPGRYHRASWANGQTDTRLSFNVSPLLFHNFGEDAGGKQ